MNGNMGGSGVFMLLVKVAGSIISVGRTIDAAVTIHRYRSSWDTLPFISPVLWLDWIGIYDLVNQFSRPCAIIAGIVGTCLYGICFWLCIGYGLAGYGTRQYYVLNVPGFCDDPGISWQTDPWRRHFLLLHYALFLSGTLGLLIVLGKLSRRIKISELQFRIKLFWIKCRVMFPQVRYTFNILLFNFTLKFWSVRCILERKSTTYNIKINFRTTHLNTVICEVLVSPHFYFMNYVEPI